MFVLFLFLFSFLKYDLSLPWMSGQNEQWDRRVFGCVAAESPISKVQTSWNGEVWNAAGVEF